MSHPEATVTVTVTLAHVVELRAVREATDEVYIAALERIAAGACAREDFVTEKRTHDAHVAACEAHGNAARALVAAARAALEMAQAAFEAAIKESLS